MSIQEILVHLDAEIARLKLARNLLAADVPARKTGMPASDKKSAAPRGRRNVESQRQEQAAQQAPLVTVLPPVARRARRNTAPAAASRRTALTSSVPSGPVAVGAAAVKAMTPPAPMAAPSSGYSFLMGTDALSAHR